MLSATQKTLAVLPLVAILVACLMALAGDQTVHDLARNRRVPLSELAPELLKRKIILVGEQHGRESHHRAQLRVIQLLVDAGAKLAIGLEIFREDSQDALNRWTAGDMSLPDFEKIYEHNWNYPWSAYSAIFEYARARRLPMIGLNVPREVTRQVAQGGFQSLNEEQRAHLSNVTCSVDEKYMRYIRRAYGAHAHGTANFQYFCEAQLVWDTAMAVRTLAYLRDHPDTSVVVLTGVGHAQREAVPRQIGLRSEAPVAVLLPQVPGSIDSRTVDRQDADYLLLDLN